MTLSGKVHSVTLSPTPFCTFRSLSLLLSLVILVHSTEVAQLGTSAFSGTPPGGGWEYPSHPEQGAAGGQMARKHKHGWDSFHSPFLTLNKSLEFSVAYLWLPIE